MYKSIESTRKRRFIIQTNGNKTKKMGERTHAYLHAYTPTCIQKPTYQSPENKGKTRDFFAGL